MTTRRRTSQRAGLMLDVLGVGVAVECDDTLLIEHASELFGALAGRGDSTSQFSVTLGADGNWELRHDGLLMVKTRTRSGMLSQLAHSVNRAIIGSTRLLIVHAGAVERNGVGFVFAGESNSGKSTLTAGLVRAGYSYLTDEATGFDWNTRAIVPYPKPLSLDVGAWALFPELEPSAELGREVGGFQQWQVSPTAIRADAVGRPCPARRVVFPRFTEHAETELRRISRADALVRLVTNTFRFGQQSHRSFRTLSMVVADADCYELAMGDLAGAIEAVDSL